MEMSPLPTSRGCCNVLLEDFVRSSEMAGAREVVDAHCGSCYRSYCLHHLHPASPSSCQVDRPLCQDGRDPDPTGKGEKYCSISGGGTWATGRARWPISSGPRKPVSHQWWLFLPTSDFLPTLEKEKLPRLFQDFPDFKNRHSSEHQSPGAGGAALG